MSVAADLAFPPQAPATSEQLAAVLRAVRLLTPGAHTRTRYEVSAAWSMLAAQLQAFRLVAHIPADSAHGRVPRDLRGAHALWSEVRDATTARLTQEAQGYARTRSPLAALLLESRTAAAATARAVDSLFEALTEGRL